MKTTDQILEEEFEAIRIDLVAQYDRLGMRSSGDWEQETEVVQKSNKSKHNAQVLGLKYTKQLIDGRSPGRFPPIQKIEEWIEEKGIKPLEDNIKISSLAFLIARKIANEGTDYFKEGGTDLIEAVITPQRIQTIIDKVSEVNGVLFQEKIAKQIESLAA